MKETKKWRYKVTSHANKNGLSDEQIEKAMKSYYHEEYQDFRNRMREKNKEYDQYPVAKWQLEKSDSLEKEWHDKLKFEITGDRVTVSVEFDVTFPESFDKGDVVEWCEGFNRLATINPMVHQKEIIDLHKKGEDIPEDFYKKSHEFLTELMSNQTFQVSQI